MVAVHHLRASERKIYPKIAPDFGPDARRFEWRISGIFTARSNAAAGSKDKQDWINLFFRGPKIDSNLNWTLSVGVFACLNVERSSFKWGLPMKKINADSLSQYNGEDGRPVYIAHKDRVIDVSGSKLWKTGSHMKRHHAGRDLTTDIQAAPHGIDVLDRYPQVGEFVREDIAEIHIPGFLQQLIARFPMLRRHPHPMTVHFPIVFMTAATIFTLLYLATGLTSFETTAFHCLGGGVLFTLVAVLTGLYTWWLNYHTKPVRAVKVKLRISPPLFGISLAAFIWRILNPNVLTNLQGMGYVYLVLVLSLFPIVTVIGWFGAQLTFPTEKE
jgi:predicted heme/steroid binding protein/uncharacterized membrane protein